MSRKKKETQEPVIISTVPKQSTALQPISISPTGFGSKISLADDSYQGGSTQMSAPRVRRNIFIDDLTRFQNIKNMRLPYYFKEGAILMKELQEVCQKAYFGVPIIRNIVDIMSEFANGDLYFEGGNKKVNTFVEAWFDRMGMWNLKQRFFREYFRGANVIMYRFDANFNETDLKQLTQTFGIKASKKTLIPIRYAILNPVNIRITQGISFFMPIYYKVLSSYEIAKLRHPTTQAEKDFFSTLPSDCQKQIKNGRNPLIPLDIDKTYGVFYKKQDYEPFSVPFFYSVLDDIEMKLDFKITDRAVARTADWMILLITAGSEEGMNPQVLTTLQQFFVNEQLKRVLVSDYTTKAEWVIPDLSKLLGKEKYEVVNADILQGLNAVLFDSTEKFANQSIKVQVFFERLVEAQQAFLNDFLQPEVKRVCKELGFKNYPIVKFADRSFKDDLEYNKLYTRLAEIGLLTAEETFDAYNTGKLPLPEDSVESQKRYKDSRQEQLYEPLLNNPLANQPPGRPAGTKAPQTTKKIKPIGASFSMEKIKDILIASNNLMNFIELQHKKIYKIKELSDEQKDACKILATSIMSNEDKDKWKDSVKDYIKIPKPVNSLITNELDTIGVTYGLDDYMSVILYLSKIEEEKEI